MVETFERTHQRELCLIEVFSWNSIIIFSKRASYSILSTMKERS